MSKVKYSSEFQQDLQVMKMQMAESINWNLKRVGKNFTPADTDFFFFEQSYISEDREITEVLAEGIITIRNEVMSIEEALNDEKMAIEEGLLLLESLENI